MGNFLRFRKDSSSVMPPQIKSKEAKKIAAANASKGKKKKWSKGKLKEKVNNLCLFNKDVYGKLMTEVPHYKIITTSILADRLNINGSLARAAIKELRAKQLIKPIVTHRAQCIYTRVTGTELGLEVVGVYQWSRTHKSYC